MDRADRQNRIIEYLRIKPTHHGQIETCLLAIPNEERLEIDENRRAEISASLIEQGANLVPLIVRRSDAYGDEVEYEVIYGEEWCVIARELGVDRLWVWMFELDDEQARVARTEMTRLAGADAGAAPTPEPTIARPDPAMARELTTLTGMVENLSGQVQGLKDAMGTIADRAGNPPATTPNPAPTPATGQSLADTLNRALDAIVSGEIRVNLSIESGKVGPPKLDPPDPDIESMTKSALQEEIKTYGITCLRSSPKPKVDELRQILKGLRAVQRS